MILIGIDIGKNSHTFSIVSRDSGEILLQPTDFPNTASGFSTLCAHLISYDKAELLIGMEDTGHYHLNLLKYLLEQHFTVALINPVATDMTRKMQGGVSKEEIQIKHLIAQIELIQLQIEEIDKKIEEFSLQMNSPILTIPGVSHFSGTSILAELGDICNYSSAAKIIKFAGLAPYEHQSSQYRAEHLPISKKGSKYLRKTLYQVILPVIRYNPVFQDYYRLKRSQGKGHRCAQGHCIRKLLRIVYHLLSTNQAFDPLLLK